MDFLIIIFILFFSLINSQEKHKVEDLFNGIYNNDIFSGYLKTDIEGNELFYVFTPSQSSPSDDPFFLWLNGGPGCSSLFGFLGEIGPVKPNTSENKFMINEYAWNQKANFLYIESPAGVGFSKIKDPKMFFDDTIAAKSLNIGLQNFFSLFTEYQKNDFYITGESYAGVYIPYLVEQITQNENNEIKLNLKGIFIGNPYTDEETDYEDSMIEFGFSHGLIGYKTFKNYLKHCPHLPQQEGFIKEFIDDSEFYNNNIDEYEPSKNVTTKCNEIRKEIYKYYHGINMYGIYKECPSYESMFKYQDKYTNINIEESYLHSYEYRYSQMRKNQVIEKYIKQINNLRFDERNKFKEDLEPSFVFLSPCGYTENDLFINNFLNDKNVKKKLGVNEEIIYERCSSLEYKWGESTDFYKNELENLAINGFKAWLFSGTEDIAVTTLGTLRWINYNNFTIDEKWKQWIVDKQVVGMEQRYTNGLTILTVKGAGHMVPEDKPKIAKIMLDNFIQSEK